MKTNCNKKLSLVIAEGNVFLF